MSSFQRVQQWLVFSRQWHIVNAKWQDPHMLGEKIARYISGSYKPFYHSKSDCGDHVIVYNCKDVALRAFDWKRTEYPFNNRYPKGKKNIPAWEIHQSDPCRILWMSTFYALRWPFRDVRTRDIEHLHLFPDENIPAELLKNVSNQLEQVMRMPKPIDDYSPEERSKIPAVFELPPTYAKDDGAKK